MKTTAEILDWLTEECSHISKHFHQAERTNIMFFSLTMLDRLDFSCRSLRVLMREMEKETKLEYSCGIIIRSVILDYMIVLNAVDILMNNQPDSRKQLYYFCSSFLADSVDRALGDISVIYSKKPQTDLDKLYANIVGLNPEFFDTYPQDGKRPVLKPEFKKALSPSKLNKQIRDSAHLSSEAGVYEAYQFYSKYDHFGQIFYEQSRKQFLGRAERFEKSVRFFPLLLHYSLFILRDQYSPDPVLDETASGVVSFIENF